jgi:hypothetical protein
MIRAALAATLLTVALCGGFLLGALKAVVDDTGPDW